MIAVGEIAFGRQGLVGLEDAALDRFANAALQLEIERDAAVRFKCANPLGEHRWSFPIAS